MSKQLTTLKEFLLIDARNRNQTHALARFVNAADLEFIQLKTLLKPRTYGARDRNRTGTPAIHEAADFKSAVSTDFTTRAC